MEGPPGSKLSSYLGSDNLRKNLQKRPFRRKTPCELRRWQNGRGSHSVPFFWGAQEQMESKVKMKCAIFPHIGIIPGLQSGLTPECRALPSKKYLNVGEHPHPPIIFDTRTTRHIDLNCLETPCVPPPGHQVNLLPRHLSSGIVICN